MHGSVDTTPMKLLDLTLESPQANVALDEALLEAAEESGQGEILRLWEPLEPMVVLGRSSRVAEEVQLEYCRANDLPIIRRSSGGGTIVTGPGCLMYALVLSFENYPEARLIDEAHRTVLDPLASALGRLNGQTKRCGISDLALADHKFSGNSLRCRRTHFLYHGTILYDFPLPLIGNALAQAPRQPEYRGGRDHDAFVTNFPAPVADIRQAIRNAWEVDGLLRDWPRERCEQLVKDKYSTAAWNFSR